ncbi:MAG: hypothetical protein HYU99_01820 [Deltaproteobacteria bacterium]|nr:hypothetical protein [Deltaproteobacteria bacterium]
MPIVKGPGAGGGGVTPAKQAAVGVSGKFEKILNEKNEKNEKTGQKAGPSEEQIKERLRALVQGGASPDEVVRIALAGHPWHNLPDRLRERVVKNVSEVITPVLKGRV